MSSKILTNILERVAENKPYNVAIESEGKLISYQDLNSRANYIANFLISLNIEKESVVTTFLSDRTLQIFSLIGIFKSGNVYLPFDQKYGQNHWQELLIKIKPKVILISREYLDVLEKYSFLLKENSTRIIILEEKDSVLFFSELVIESFKRYQINTDSINYKNPELHIENNDSNYIFFTSGTTGKPKAVLGSHISLSHFIHWEIKELNINEAIQVAQITSLSFDASLRDIFLAFITASTLHIPDQTTRENPNALIKWLIDKKINLLHSIPTMLRVIINAGEDAESDKINFDDLQYILLAGEKLYVKDITKWKNQFGGNVVFYNLYGATESTLIKTFYKITDNQLEGYQNESIPAGQPISNTKILILNENNELCKINERGRIYIKTPFLSKGYYKDADTTALKFIQNPLNTVQDIIYSTGDLGKYDNDRNLIVLGREDGEVKINGVRVDINSMESTISGFDDIEMAKCILYNKNNDNRIICFYTSKILTEADVKKYCLEYLTVYEQPMLVKIDRFPTNANGKVDVEKLKQNVENYISEKREMTLPSNSTEEKVLDIWKEILENDIISTKDNFFSVGGHSIKAFKLLNKISKEFNIHCNLNEIYSNPTIVEFAAFLDTQTESHFEPINKVPEQNSYLCSNSQKRMWLASLKEENSNLYNVPIYFKIKGNTTPELLNATFLTLIDKHEILRTKFKFEKGELYQYIEPIKNLKGLVEVIERCHDMDSFINTEIDKGFDLQTEVPIRVKLIRNTEGSETILLIIIHHIAYDGWSKPIIFHDILSIYKNLIQNKPYMIDPMRVTYKDYVYWYETKLTKQEAFWKSFFDNTYDSLNFPLDFPRSKTTTKKGSLLKATIEKEKLSSLKDKINKLNISLADYFIGALGALLNSYTHQDNIVIGTITSGRNHIDLENIVGSFINYIPINISVNSDETLNVFFSNLKDGLIQCYNNQNYPYDLMVENFTQAHDNLRNPIFDIIAVFHHDENKVKHIQGIDEIEIDEYHTSLSEDYKSKVDIKFDINFANEEAYISIEYNTDLFKKETIEKLCKNLIHITDGLCCDFEIKMADFKNKIEDKLQIDHSNVVPVTKNNTKIISSFTIEQIKDTLLKSFEDFGIENNVSFGAYNQIINELSQETLAFNKMDSLIVLNRYEDYLNNNGNEDNIEYIKYILVKKLKDLPENLVKLVGIFPCKESNSFYSVIEKYNETTIEEIRNIPNTFIIDFRSVRTFYPDIQIFDDYKNNLAHIPFTDEFSYIIGLYISRTLSAIKNTAPFKVIALDCDNTLWKGICGESDIEEIKIEEGYKQLQNFILKKYDEGFLIVLTSKNNEEDVFNIFENHPDMILQKKHIVSWRINWQDKSENIRDLARELNLNINSFIFIDDNPWECQQMLIENPEVLTLLLPEKEIFFNQFLHRVTAFDKAKISEEDKHRSNLYKAEQKRKEFSENLSKKEFIRDLNLKVSFRTAKKNDIDRVSQLLNRTNQFVLNKQIWSTENISYKITQQNCYVIHVSDRFGNYGLTGIVILSENSEYLMIESFNLSCRILGKEIENCILDIIKHISKERGKNKILLNYVRTAKNKYFQEFLDNRKDILLYEKEGNNICELKVEPIEKYDDITLYINEDIPQKQTIDFYFDHTGIAVKDIEKVKEYYSSIGFKFGDVVFDPLQNCFLSIGKHKNYNDIELVQGYENDIIEGIEKHRNGLPYHICYRVKNIEEVLSFFIEEKINFDTIKSPQPAILFENKRVMFLYLQNLGIIELLEDETFDYSLSYNVYKTIEMYTGNISEAKRNFEKMGYRSSGEIMANNTNYITLKKSSTENTTINLDFESEKLLNGIMDNHKETIIENLEWIEQMQYDRNIILHKNVYKALEVSNYSYFNKINGNEEEIAGEGENAEWSEILRGIYMKILGDKFINAEVDFFEMGGNSLMSTQILSRLYYNYNVEIDIVDFFNNSSIKKLSNLIISKENIENKNEIII